MLKFGGHTLGRSLECNMRSKIRWFTDSANHTTYRISLRSSSLREPRHPLLRVISTANRQRVIVRTLHRTIQSVGATGGVYKGQGRPYYLSRLRSRSLTELTRQITPPTKNGHAPPPIESRKSSQSVNHTYVWTW
ncbi:unnamed protein product [Bathycoccus prasinos]